MRQTEAPAAAMAQHQSRRLQFNKTVPRTTHAINDLVKSANILFELNNYIAMQPVRRQASGFLNTNACESTE